MPILVICFCIVFLWLDNINLFDHFWIQICLYADITFAVLVFYLPVFFNGILSGQHELYIHWNDQQTTIYTYSIGFLYKMEERKTAVGKVTPQAEPYQWEYAAH